LRNGQLGRTPVITDNDPKPSICFVAHLAYGALTGGSSGFIGGVERQTSLMAKWFAARGYRVTFLTWDEGQPEGTVVDGVRVIKMCRRDEGLSGIRFFHPRWTSLNAAMRQADADVYYQNCGEYVTGQVAMWCRRHRRRFVYSVASDPDCDARLPEMKAWRVRVLYRYGLRHADCVIVQTNKQRQMLRSSFGLESTVLPMPCPDISSNEAARACLARRQPFRVGWVGRFVEMKRLELLLDLAEAMPDIAFEVVGGSTVRTDYVRSLERRAGMLPNVRLHGMLSRNDMQGFYNRISCLCCTSAYEGFPNTVLAAWCCGLPSVSTLDPDRLIEQRGLGVHADNIDGLKAGLTLLIESPETWRRASENARRYYVETQSVEVVMPRFEQVILGLPDH